jgi:hypothetical protein
MENDPDFVFTLPTLSSVISEVKKEDDTESWSYQDQTLKHFKQAKVYIQSHAVEIVNKIISCFDQRFLSVHEENEAGGVSVTAEEGDKIIFDVCQILNCSVWPTLQIEDDEETILRKQLQALKNLYDRYNDMEIFNEISWEAVLNGFVDIVHYASQYFSLPTANPIDLWGKIIILSKNKPNWKGISLIVEICLCAPFSNASLERFFSHMNIVKTETRNRLSQKSLNAILAIRMFGISLAEFNKSYVKDCVSKWYNDKDRRLGQKKRKTYKKRESVTKKRKTFDIRELSSSEENTTDDENTSDDELN